jgi:hypothetical protein
LEESQPSLKWRSSQYRFFLIHTMKGLHLKQLSLLAQY